MGHVVGYQRIVVHVLPLVGNDAAVARALSTLAHHIEVQLVARHAVVQRDDIMVHPAVGLLLYIDIAHPGILVVRLLQTVQVQLCILAHIGLDDLCRQEVAVIGSVVAEQELRLGTLLHHDQHAAVHHQVDIRTQNVDDLDGSVQHHSLGHIDKQTILRQHRVQVGHGVIVLSCQAVVAARGEGRGARGMLFQRTDNDTLR